MRLNLSSFISLIVVTFLFSCKNEPSSPLPSTYLHISHTRTDSNPNLDSTVEKINFKKYDVLMLGGDLANLTSEDNQTMNHADSIFDFNNKTTLWSLGNHDYTDLSRVQEYTQRPPYYSYHKNGITYVILDTQDSLTNIIGEQKKFFNSVVDTIQKSSHLIVLHHKLMWMDKNDALASQAASIANGGLGNCFYCINPNNFYDAIYPQLLKLKKNGIEVVCIAGDIGFKVNQFEYTTPEGIHFLASGIRFGSADNKALLFEHHLKESKLTWKFVPITEL